jgi:hypothetical protein
MLFLKTVFFVIDLCTSACFKVGIVFLHCMEKFTFVGTIFEVVKQKAAKV